MFSEYFVQFIADLFSAHLFDNWLGFLTGLIFLAGSCCLGLLVVPEKFARPAVRALCGAPLSFIFGGTLAIAIYFFGGTVFQAGVFLCFVFLAIIFLSVFLKKFTGFFWRDAVIVLVILFLSYILMFFGWGEMRDGTLRAISGSWGDGVLHTLNAEAFKIRHGRDFSMPAFAGEQMREPFGYDFVSGMFLSLGFGIGSAFTLPATVLFASLIAVIFQFTKSLVEKRLTGSKMQTRCVAIVASLLVLLGSGIQWLVMAQKTQSWRFSRFFGVHDPVWDKAEEIGLIWANHLNTFVSQKHFLLATAFLLILAYCFFYLIQNKEEVKNNRMLLTAMTITTAVLPLFHVHAFIAAALLWLVFWLITLRREVFALGLLIILISAPILFTFTGAVGRQGFMHLQIGYLAPPNVWAWIIFWVVNLGFFLPVSIYVLTNKKFGKEKILLGVPAVILFILGNLIQFQPYLWDNHKIFLFAWFLLLPLVVAQVWEWFIILNKAKTGLFPAAVLVVFFLISMVLTTVSEVSTYFAFRVRYPLFTPVDRAEANYLKKVLPEDAVVLAPTDVYHKHPVTLTGRNLVLGYGGWIWSRGLGLENRSTQIEAILTAPNKENLCVNLKDVKATHIVADQILDSVWGASVSSEFRKVIGGTNNYPKVIAVKEICN